MSQTFQFRSYRKHIYTVDDVLLQMTNLDEELADSTLRNLRPFNTTYKIITSSVKDLLGTGYFNNDELMQALDVRFAHYFFSPLLAHMLRATEHRLPGKHYLISVPVIPYFKQSTWDWE